MTEPAPSAAAAAQADPVDPRADQGAVSRLENPPNTIPGILMRLGPGLIIAGSIVGSGELIATPRTGAEAGFWLLWLIIIGCVIKVFVQIEFGRFTLVTGETSMAGMNQVPGPRFKVSWLLWYWLFMFLASLAQLGGIVGGVGQALAMSVPITGDFNLLLEKQEKYDLQAIPLRKELTTAQAPVLKGPDRQAAKDARKAIDDAIEKQLGVRPSEKNTRTWDDRIWATLITVVTAIWLMVGRYQLIEWASTILVAGFTFVTIFNLIALQMFHSAAMTWSDLWTGLSFQLPPAKEGTNPVMTALKTFGIIGVGATELIAYPYWCLEKGYARFTGPRDASDAWAMRAKGWMRVLQWDAWCSMVVYTFATVVFYLLGATVLARHGTIPEGNQMIRTLGRMYSDVFGAWTDLIFLGGAFAVLYSTFFIANAGHARTASDAFRLWGVIGNTPEQRVRWVKYFSGLFPVLCLICFITFGDPVRLVLISGMMQALMLPMLAGATLFFRYYRCDARLKPSLLWDFFLWLSSLGMLVAGLSLIWLVIAGLLAD